MRTFLEVRLQALAKPKMVGGRRATGKALAGLLTELVEGLNQQVRCNDGALHGCNAGADKLRLASTRSGSLVGVRPTRHLHASQQAAAAPSPARQHLVAWRKP